VTAIVSGPFAIARALLLTMAWPAAAAVSLAVSVGGRDVAPAGLLLLACGTMAAYGLDRWIDRRDRDPQALRRALAVCVVSAAIATGALACTDWWRVQVCAVLAVLAGAYVPLKRRIPKNVLTTVAWTAAVATLPFSGRPHMDPALGAAVFAVACIMAANTMLCDIPDFAADRRAGVVGITPKFGPRAGAIAAVTFGCLGSLVALWGGRWGLAATALGLAVLAIPLARNPSRVLFRHLADGLVTVLPGPLALLFR
jgi:4-hydroxybenzoate polyprenyltransferase